MQTTRLRPLSIPCCLFYQRISLSSSTGSPTSTSSSSLCWILFQLSTLSSRNLLWLLSFLFCLSPPSKTYGRITGDTGRIKKSTTWIVWSTACKYQMLADAQASCLSVCQVCCWCQESWHVRPRSQAGQHLMKTNHMWTPKVHKIVFVLPSIPSERCEVNEVFHQCRYGRCAIILLIIRQQVTWRPVACSGLYYYYYFLACVCVLCILLMKSSTVVHVQSIIHSNQKPRCSVASQYSLTRARSPCEGRP